MSLQMFMNITGVPGDSTNYFHKGWSEFTSWNWDMDSSRGLASRSGEDLTSLNEISIVKPIGVDSANIRLLFAQGKKIPRVELSITPVVERRQAQSKYLAIVMEEVLIKSIACRGDTAESFFQEKIAFLFERVAFQYCKSGTVASAGTNRIDTPSENYSFGWNVDGNDAWTPQAVSA